MKVSILGPLGSTFSSDAYDWLARRFDIPLLSQENGIAVASNSEVVPSVLKNGGFGVLAMETLSGGRVTENLESFISLLHQYSTTKDCPISIIGAVKAELNFCLMTRNDVSESDITMVLAHAKAIDACRQNIKQLNLPAKEASSNGEAARLVAEETEYANAAALGPSSAAIMFGLKIIHNSFQDKRAVTTFFLLAPRSHYTVPAEENRALLIFNLENECGSLVKVLQLFADDGLNLIKIHSIYAGDSTYNFAVEVEADKNQLPALNRVLVDVKKYVNQHLVFGPFPVLST